MNPGIVEPGRAGRCWRDSASAVAIAWRPLAASAACRRGTWLRSRGGPRARGPPSRAAAVANSGRAGRPLEVWADLPIGAWALRTLARRRARSPLRSSPGPGSHKIGYVMFTGWRPRRSRRRSRGGSRRGSRRRSARGPGPGPGRPGQCGKRVDGRWTGWGKLCRLRDIPSSCTGFPQQMNKGGIDGGEAGGSSSGRWALRARVFHRRSRRDKRYLERRYYS